MTIPMRRTLQSLKIAVVIMATLTFLLASLLPIYTDEIYWKMQLGRLLFDGSQTIGTTGALSCGPYAFPVSAVLMPYRWVDWQFYRFFDTPLMLRLGAVAVAMISVAFVGSEFSKLLSPMIARSTSFVGTLAVITLGVLPFGLVVSRPEQLLLLTIAVLTIRSCRTEGPEIGRSLRLPEFWHNWGGALAVGLVGGMVIASHPKGMYFLPTLLIAAFLSARRVWPRIVAVAISVVTALNAYSYWKVRLACPNDASIRAAFASRTLFSAIDSGLTHAFLTEQLSATPIKFTYVWLILFRHKYLADWLPSSSMTPFVHLIDDAIELILLVLLLAGAVAIFLLIWQGIRTRSQIRQTLSVSALWTSLGLLSLSTGAASDYEGTLMVPLFALASALSVWFACGALVKIIGLRFSGRILVSFFCGIAIVSVASQLTLLSIFGPEAANWWKGGYLKSQTHSVSAFGYSQLQPEIVRTAALCGIVTGPPEGHLVVDELTYFAFIKSSQPILLNYVAPNSWGRNIPDLSSLLGSVGSGGMIVACDAVPPSLADTTINNGLFCCHPAFRSAPEGTHRGG